MHVTLADGQADAWQLINMAERNGFTLAVPRGENCKGFFFFFFFEVHHRIDDRGRLQDEPPYAFPLQVRALRECGNAFPRRRLSRLRTASHIERQVLRWSARV